MTAYPALFIVPGRSEEHGEYSYTNPDNLPPTDEIREVVVDELEAVWGNATTQLRDVYEGDLKVQHEIPPTDPYDAYGVTVVFGQLPVLESQGGARNEDPFEIVKNALIDEYGREVELWLSAVEQ